MAEQFKVGKGLNTQTINYTAKASKYARLNYMTIPQIKAAKNILAQKINNNDLDSNLKYKLVDLHNQYEKTEREINKYYQKFATDPRTKHLIAGKKNMLTISKINKKDYTKGEALKYGLRDKANNIRLDKIAMGVGIAALSLGVAGQISSAVFGQSLTQLLGELIKAMWANNPAALIAIGAGVGLIAASKIVPACNRAADRAAMRKFQLNQLQNQLTDEHEKNIDQFDADLLHENAFKEGKNKDVLVSSFYNNPVQVLQSLNIPLPDYMKAPGFFNRNKVDMLSTIGTPDQVSQVIACIKSNKDLTPTQKTNLIQVVKESAVKANEAQKQEQVTEEELGITQDEPTDPTGTGSTSEDDKDKDKDPAVATVEASYKDVLFDIYANGQGALPKDPVKLVAYIQNVRPEMSAEEATLIAQQIAADLQNRKGKTGAQAGLETTGPQK